MSKVWLHIYPLLCYGFREIRNSLGLIFGDATFIERIFNKHGFWNVTDFCHGWLSDFKLYQEKKSVFFL